jgi:DNA mismatch endonuclease, patch repair protein
MADLYSRKKRSEIMSRIRSTGTKPEQRLIDVVRTICGRRKLLLNVRELPGCPDVVIPSLRVAIFADGCFYHGCPHHGHNPKSNRAYWLPKLERNRLRDATHTRRLRRMGFGVWRIWEHDLKSSRNDYLQRRLGRLLCDRINSTKPL